MCKAGFAGDDAPRAVFRKKSYRGLLIAVAISLYQEVTDIFDSFYRR